MSQVKEMELSDRLKASLKKVKADVASTAPSLVPSDPIPPPPDKEEEVIPDIRDFISDAKIRLHLRRLIVLEREQALIESAAKKARKPFTDAIKKIMGTYKIGKAASEDFVLNYYSTSRSSIVADLLLAHNISPATIAECTKTSTSFTLRIGERGAEDEE